MGVVGERPRPARDVGARRQTARRIYVCVMAARTGRSSGLGIHRPAATRRPLDDQQISLIVGWSDENSVCRDETVDLAPDSHLAGEIDARFDRKAHAGNERALLARLEVVDVWSGAVQIPRIDRVAGAVDEELAIAALGDYFASGIVDLATAYGFMRADPCFEQRDGRVARIAYCQPNRFISIAWSTERSHPCLVGEDSLLLARPEIHEQDIAALDRRGFLGGRFVMRI